MKILFLTLIATLLPLAVNAEGISPPLKRPLLACQQKLCPNPRPPFAEGDMQPLKRPLLAEGIVHAPRPLVA